MVLVLGVIQFIFQVFLQSITAPQQHLKNILGENSLLIFLKDLSIQPEGGKQAQTILVCHFRYYVKCLQSDFSRALVS